MIKASDVTRAGQTLHKLEKETRRLIGGCLHASVSPTGALIISEFQAKRLELDKDQLQPLVDCIGDLYGIRAKFDPGAD